MVNNWGGIGKGMIAELTRNRRTAKKNPLKIKKKITSLHLFQC